MLDTASRQPLGCATSVDSLRFLPWPQLAPSQAKAKGVVPRPSP